MSYVPQNQNIKKKIAPSSKSSNPASVGSYEVPVGPSAPLQSLDPRLVASLESLQVARVAAFPMAGSWAVPPRAHPPPSPTPGTPGAPGAPAALGAPWMAPLGVAWRGVRGSPLPSSAQSEQRHLCGAPPLGLGFRWPAPLQGCRLSANLRRSRGVFAAPLSRQSGPPHSSSTIWTGSRPHHSSQSCSCNVVGRYLRPPRGPSENWWLQVAHSSWIPPVSQHPPGFP